MRYWWVNHRQTARQEISDGYLWSPKREANGARSQFYENMRVAEPGDTVLSFSNSAIGHVGLVLDFASAVSKPSSFGATGDNWSSDGWLLPMAWTQLARPIRPKDRIGELRPLLPLKYSPINPVTGYGHQKAYLAEINADVVELLIGVPSPAVQIEIDGSDADLRLQYLDDLAQIALSENSALDATTKQQLVLARRGQGLFRMRVLEHERGCRLTGVESPRLLVASHIKPWRTCASAAERLDGANGLLLAPHVDRLFDRGLISFKADGEVLVSPRLNPLDLHRLGLVDACAKNCGEFTGDQASYLSFHRENVFLP
ncbi:HNH endonuclease signature motif containing protein [Rhizobium sp. NZLR1]|uniref:HNH endonuclease n=1 Tax=Rhizobium sp. NZLR1 TaxID=2731096 RepID=UPI001C82FF75|nr:HNH endonuclease signature motif containing protein [Rhizobium sp. NZLR1]MBX5206103.1 HNH endonuclease [Rhizobium sp. NZLR1]